MNALTFYRELAEWILNHVTDTNMFYVQSIVTCVSLVWLLHRAWQTLWTPVPKLISILGVEVPDAPAVSLAGIKADAVTLHWTRPGVNKPVLKYLIQVNGVNVGDSSRMETAITVTGLKPGHFYNVRVIAVGSNNFQAGSRVIRLRTYGRDGRPQLGNSRIASNLSVDEQESGDELPSVRLHGAGIEAVAAPDTSPSQQRESNSTQSGQRRNTGGRKHSPSIAAADQAASDPASSNNSQASMEQLTIRFEAIRKETEEVLNQILKDAEEYKTSLAELTKERDEKRQQLKEKEEASEKLKKEVNSSERANRQAQTKRAQRKKQLEQMEEERAKKQDEIAKWNQEIENMKLQRETWLEEKGKFLLAKEAETDELQEMIREGNESISGLEQEIHAKGLRQKDFEEERKRQQPPEDSEESRARDAAEKREDAEWDAKQRTYNEQLNHLVTTLRGIEYTNSGLQNRHAALVARQTNDALMYQANSSGVDFDPMNGSHKPKSRRSRKGKSRTSTLSSPSANYASIEPSYPSTSAHSTFNMTSPAFAPGLYMDLSNDTAMVPLSEQMSGMSEADIKALTAGAPLSPTATSLLPSNIFADDDPPSPRPTSTKSLEPAPYPPLMQAGLEKTSGSPSSSSRSASLISSPQASSQNLPMYGVPNQDYFMDADRRSMNSPRAEFSSVGSPKSSVSGPATNRGFSHLFSKNRGKSVQQEGPALGSLKPGQSQSFPRSTDDPSAQAPTHRRRTSLTGWNMQSIFHRSSTVGEATEGNGPAPARNPPHRRRRFGMFGGGSDDPVTFSDRDPSSPRPVSIASSDLPRPSTDSSQFGWPAAEGVLITRNSPLATNWSIAPAQPWSRNPSRRPSLQHGSTTALTSGIASEDDEFLPPAPPPSDAIHGLAGQASPPPSIGVIGTRPVSSHRAATPKLNPAAPTFMARFRASTRTEKGKDGTKGKERTVDSAMPSTEGDRAISTTSPSERRRSHDTPSVRTQNSTAESYESLEIIPSNSPSDATNPSTKEKESSFRQLLRKGSSSKFSLSSMRHKDSGIFSSKKGGGSANNSDRAERDGSIDGSGEDGLVHSLSSSPALGAGEWGGRGTPKEGRMWSRFSIKKGKTRESLDVDRSEAETTGTEDEGG